ncbi:MAG TPA: hypothetical protein VF618_01725 [Thermoanaerobaculia bacterium]
MRTIRPLLLGISALGVLLFGVAFVTSYVRPLLVESVARELVRREIEARVRERIAAVTGSPLVRLAQRAIARNSREIADAERKLAAGLPEKVAAVVAQMQDPDCECRKFVAAATRSLLTEHILARSAANEQLQRLIRSKYAEVVQALLRELRIFTGANALVFLLLGATTYFRRAAGLQLLLPAFVLVGAAIVVGALYLFAQNWLHTILFADYVGLGYFAYLGAAMLFLADVAFNRARVTTQIVNAGLNVVGAAVQAVPC